MRIAFIRPRASFNGYMQFVPPLNYIHLAAWLRQHGHKADILDMIFDAIAPEAVDRKIREQGIGVAGIGCTTWELPQAVEEARRLKGAHPHVKVVFGGAHPSGDPAECLKTGVVDYVVVGEGEIALTGLLEALEAAREPDRIAGVWSIRHGTIQENGMAPAPDVETLPMPAYDQLDLERYFRLDSPWFTKSPRAVQMITSRGCPYRCSYCHSIHGKRFRGLSPERVVGQMEHLIKTQGVEEFLLVDDVFNLDLERAKAICRGIVARKLKVHLQFPNGVRGDRFDEELVGLMKAAGTHYMAIAIETVSERLQKLIRKNLRIDKALQTMRWARKYGIETSGFFMIGFPGETLEDVQRTVEFALSAPLDAIEISLVKPFKGTALRSEIVGGRFGEMDPEGLAALEQLSPTVHNEALTPELLTKIQRQAYWRFYARPRPLLNLGRKLAHRQNLFKLLRAVRRRMFHSEVAGRN